MAYVQPDATPAYNSNTGNGNGFGNGRNTAPKTTRAYVNFYLPLKDGTRIKLFSDLTLRLYEERVAESKLADMIKNGLITPEQIQQLIQVEISLARDESVVIEFAL